VVNIDIAWVSGLQCHRGDKFVRFERDYRTADLIEHFFGGITDEKRRKATRQAGRSQLL
jgi:hypothetical protein